VLGADGRRIVGLVIREGLGWTAAGISAGMLAALALSRYVSSLLFHVGKRDPITYLSVTILLVGIAVLATAIPASRAVQSIPCWRCGLSKRATPIAADALPTWQASCI